MMVEAEATEASWNLIKGESVGAPTEEVVAEGLEAAKPFIAQLCAAQADLAAAAAKPVAEFPIFPDYADDAYAAVEAAVRRPGRGAARSPTSRSARPGSTRSRPAWSASSAEPVRGPREGDLRGIPRGAEEADPSAHPARQGPHRRPRPGRHPPALGRGRGPAAGARLGAVRARRDPDPGRHHAEHAADGADARHAVAGDAQALHAQLQLPALLSTGETGRVGSPKRREIGHGALAERALMPVLPTREEFPYAIRQVSEALSSNGSTSMGSVCASTLSLLNAGVPLRAPVAGHRDGPGLRRGRRRDALRGADRHPRRRGRVRRHGLQGRRHQRVRHRHPARHQARRHPRLGAGRRADPGPRRPPAHPRRDGRGHRRARTR